MFFVALGIGVFGTIFGIAGVVIANGASNELAALKVKVEQTQDPLTVLKPKLDELDERIGNIGAETMRANNGLRDASTKIQQLAQAISEDRERINKNTAALTGKRAPAAAKPVVAAEKAEATAPATTNASGQSVHTIASGDNFWTLARQYGVSAKAIQDANPNADPKNLKIGQQIVIPVAAATTAPVAAPAVAPSAETN